MTKKDFILIAEEMMAKGLTDDIRVAYDMAEAFILRNPIYKRERWLYYLNGKCGPNGGKK